MMGKWMLAAVLVAMPLGVGLAQDRGFQQMEDLFQWRDAYRHKIHQKLEGAMERLEGEREKATHGFMEKQHSRMEAVERQKVEKMESIERDMERAMEKLERNFAQMREKIEMETRQVMAHLEHEAEAFHRELDKKISHEAERIHQGAEKAMHKVTGMFEKKLEALKNPAKGKAPERRRPARARPMEAVKPQPDPPHPEPARSRVMNTRLKARLEQLEEERAKILEHLEMLEKQVDRGRRAR